MGLENRVTPGRDLPHASRAICSRQPQEGLARSGRRQPDQLDLRASGQRQEDRIDEDHLVSIRADAVRRLDRGEPEPEAITSRSTASEEARY
jgi:hypothetical protein